MRSTKSSEVNEAVYGETLQIHGLTTYHYCLNGLHTSTQSTRNSHSPVLQSHTMLVK